MRGDQVASEVDRPSWKPCAWQWAVCSDGDMSLRNTGPGSESQFPLKMCHDTQNPLEWTEGDGICRQIPLMSGQGLRVVAAELQRK